MIERLFSARVPGAVKERLVRWKRTVPPRLMVICAVPVFFAGWLLYSALPDHPHLTEIVDSYGSIGLLYGPPRPDAAGSRIAYVQQSEHGMGVFLCDSRSGKSELVFEQMEPLGFDLRVWPWSPRDKWLLYSSTSSMVVWDVDTRQPVQEISLPANGISQAAWLTPDSFVCICKTGMVAVRRQTDGRWETELLLPTESRIYNLTALSSNELVWREAERVVSFNVQSKAVTTVLNFQTLAPKGETLEDFAVASGGEEFLVTSKHPWSRMLWRYSRQFPKSLEKVAAPAMAGYGLWMGTNGAFACLAPRKDNNSVLLYEPGRKPTSLFTRGDIDSFTVSADGERLFAVGVCSNEPSAGLWEYDIASETLRLLVSPGDRVSSQVTRVVPQYGTVTLHSGRKLDLWVYLPPGYDRHARKKYPLVLGNTTCGTKEIPYQQSLHGPLWAQALANCGACVAIVNRETWFYDLDLLGESVLAAYAASAENPTIDLDRTYIFAASAETAELSKLVEQRPELWRGVILFNPGVLPELSRLPQHKPAPEFYFSYGALENRKQQFTRYEQEAFPKGVLVHQVVSPGAAHSFAGKLPIRQRLDGMVNFIFRD